MLAHMLPAPAGRGCRCAGVPLALPISPAFASPHPHPYPHPHTLNTLQAEAADALARRAEAEARYAEAVEALHSRQHAGGMQVCCWGPGGRLPAGCCYGNRALAGWLLLWQAGCTPDCSPGLAAAGRQHARPSMLRGLERRHSRNLAYCMAGRAALLHVVLVMLRRAPAWLRLPTCTAPMGAHQPAAGG